MGAKPRSLDDLGIELPNGMRSLSEGEYRSLPPEVRAKIPVGRPCPWCERLIVNSWTHHTFVVKDGVVRRPAEGNLTGLLHDGDKAGALGDGLWGDCPHCGEVYAMQVISGRRLDNG